MVGGAVFTGGWVVIVQVYVAVAVLPAASIACTVNVCGPSGSEL